MAIAILALVTAVGAAAADPQSVGIMFVNNGGLFGVRPDDNSLSLVRGNSCPGVNTLPCPVVKAMSWSPDGTRLAFTFGTQLYVYDSRDGSQRLLPTGVDADGGSAPAWSPDGRELAFSTVITEEGVQEARPSGGYSSGSTTSQSDLYAIDIDSGAVRRLTSARQTIDPAWAPGPQIVFSALNGSRWDLFIVDPGGPRQLTDGGAPLNRRAAWSPRGTEIAFLRDAGSNQARLNIIRPDGTGLSQISNLPVDLVLGDQPAWSPDGSLIAVSTSINGQLDVITGNRPGRDLYVVAPDGTGERRLTQSAERGVADRGPSWSPDGRQIAFESYDRDKASESALYMVSADGRCEMRVAAVGGRRPLWQPRAVPALATRDCADLSVTATEVGRQGAASHFRIKLINDGTRPLSGIRLRSNSPQATVLSASSRDARCSVSKARLDCELAALAPAAFVDVEAFVEARVFVRIGKYRLGPDIGFFASSRGSEVHLGNNRLTNKLSTATCSVATPGSGSITGTESNDRICGRSGRDRIAGLQGNDSIAGGSGNDRLDGGPGNDVITTGPGADVVKCGAGVDRVVAEGPDRISRDCERVI